MSYGTTKIYVTDLDVLPVKMTTHHIIYMEKEYDDDLNFFIQKHYHEIRNHFKERKFEFCYFPRMTESELRNFVKEEYFPKGILPLSSMALRSTLLYDCQPNYDKRESLISSPSLFFCTRDPLRGPYQNAIYRMLSLDMSSQWYLKKDFSNQLNDICNYLARDPNIPYDSEEEAERLYMDPEFLASLPEPDFDNYNQDEVDRELALDFDEGSLRHDISKLREIIEEKVYQLNLMGHDSIYRYELIRKHKDEYDIKGYPILYIRKDFTIFIDIVEEDIQIDLDPIHKAIYFLFLLHPDGIELEHMNMYEEELKKIYELFKPSTSSKTDKNENNTVYILFNPEIIKKTKPEQTNEKEKESLKKDQLSYIRQRFSRIRGIFKKAIGNEIIAKAYSIEEDNNNIGILRIHVAKHGCIGIENIRAQLG